MGKSEDLAENRTDWAEDRTLMANERTFASWTGGGMGAIGLALAFKAVFGDFDPPIVARVVAQIPLIAAIVLFWSARRKACHTIARLNERTVEAASTVTLTIITSLMTATAVGAGFILWFV
ncbi:DUF202 domain-containing protein [Pseudooctadecabacter sp.]|uniref:DUF202 domain-containing protein n=1 Tax=Pseudooctadecabacter sp. TaxID=1966338 RepID=UPI0025FA1DB8|nr:DUF202 domain-containing protein [Pseudooctadecabacter sp.]